MTPWNKGKTWKELGHDTSKFGKSKPNSEETRQKIRTKRAFQKPHLHTEEAKEKIRQAALARKLGGYQHGSGRGKKGWYKGYFCDSSYELAWIIYNIDHDIKFKRNTKKFKYTIDNKTKNWIPDFQYANGLFVEIKGYDTAESKAKRKCFTEPLVCMKTQDLKEVFMYVTYTYGKNFIQLYEEG